MNTPKNSKQITIYILPILAISFLTAIDQLTKYMVTSDFVLYESRPVIEGIFSFTYIRNEGIAWGMFAGGRIIFSILAILIIPFLLWIYHRTVELNAFKFIRVATIFLAAGAIGNLIDRIKLGYVIDFLEFKFIDFPVFNVADIYVTVTMILVFIFICFIYKDEELEKLIPKKNK